LWAILLFNYLSISKTMDTNSSLSSTNDDQQTSETNVDRTLVNMPQTTTSQHEQSPSTNDDLVPVSNDASSSVNNMIPSSTSSMSGINTIHNDACPRMRLDIYA
jgi:hypothetical protein